MLVKIHKSYRDVVAICDSRLLGNKFEQGNMQIDLTGEFFNGDEKCYISNNIILDIFSINFESNQDCIEGIPFFQITDSCTGFYNPDSYFSRSVALNRTFIEPLYKCLRSQIKDI